MIPAFVERPNNTPEQIEAYLADALALVDKLDPPDDLRVAAYEKAVDLFSGKQLLADNSPAIAGLLNGLGKS